MTSRFGWVDQDDEQRRKMLAVVEHFKEEGTVDELGVGSIRDALADACSRAPRCCTLGPVTS